jgi:hypothetical protein
MVTIQSVIMLSGGQLPGYILAIIIIIIMVICTRWPSVEKAPKVSD